MSIFFLIPVLVMAVGLLIYHQAEATKIAETGRIMFLIGLFFLVAVLLPLRLW